MLSHMTTQNVYKCFLSTQANLMLYLLLWKDANMEKTHPNPFVIMERNTADFIQLTYKQQMQRLRLPPMRLSVYWSVSWYYRFYLSLFRVVCCKIHIS